MKRIINTLIISLTAFAAFSCMEEENYDMAMNESIVLDLSSSLTKAVKEDNATESFVNHIDVFIFEATLAGPGKGGYYGRYIVNNQSKVTLEAKRSSFQVDQQYYVYLLANSTFSETKFNAVSTFSQLRDHQKQEDRNVHITGLSIENAPEYFLMDAVGVDASSSAQIVLNNGVLSDNTVIDATLKRAAAKVYINIVASEKVEFKPFGVEQGSDGGVYYVRNLPYDTFLLAQSKAADEIEANVRTTAKANNEYFTWNPSTSPKKVTLTTYVYPNHWIDASVFDHETCVVMNLPLTYTSDGVSKDHHNSWYKIHMTDNQTLERNKYYEVNIDLNRPGAISESTPIELEHVYYSVKDWTEQTINVGGEDKPVYLMVNESEMDMHNISVDSETLEFASSSPVTITVKDIYYYNKFGVKTTDAPVITGTTDGGIAGNITVNSSIPTNNAIRYFTLVVTNQEGLSREVQVAQYPLEYITNVQGWYSYRSDFYNAGNPDPTTYQYKGSRRVAANWEGGGWDYSTSVENNYFFGSKVAFMNSDGTSDLEYYSWSQYGNNVSSQTGNLGSLNNARMYHVQITSSSGKYIVGIPKQDADGFTDHGTDNARLVSPSFMIASQLGATQPPQSLTQAERHCREYVEVHDPDGNPSTDNAVHYDNWRLPTEAEIKIIIDFQYVPNAAMDEVLSGKSYWSATGPVSNPLSTSSSTGTSAVRCIRDIY